MGVGDDWNLHAELLGILAGVVLAICAATEIRRRLEISRAASGVVQLTLYSARTAEQLRVCVLVRCFRVGIICPDAEALGDVCGYERFDTRCPGLAYVDV